MHKVKLWQEKKTEIYRPRRANAICFRSSMILLYRLRAKRSNDCKENERIDIYLWSYYHFLQVPIAHDG